MKKALYERTRILEEQRLIMENDLRNLGRMELLQVLLRVTESNEALMAENAELRSASTMQVSRSAKVGSIAEEALRVNGFFEAAQRSADDYLREIMKLRDEMIERSKAQAVAQASRGAAGVSDEDQLEQSQLFERIQDQAKTYIQDVQTYANNVMARANSQAQGIIDDARMRSDEIIAQANDQAQTIIEEAEARVALKEALPMAALAAEEVIEEFVEEAAEEVSEESEFPTEELEAVVFEAEDIEAVESEAVELAAEEPEFEEPEAAEPAAEAPVAEELEVAELAEEESVDEAPEAEELLQEAAAVEELFEADIPIEEPPVEEPSPQDFAEEDAFDEAAIPDEPIAEEPEAGASQSTAPLNIDVIVSDIAAAAFSEGELDPNSTGALVRRGRHVKIPEGMTL